VQLGKYSIGIGDRFGQQGRAQLVALEKAKAAGVDITPVWNKSFREHQIIGTSPADVRQEADSAVADTGWEGPYFVDADHINLKSVDAFLAASDFFTLDVADYIGERASDSDIKTFTEALAGFAGDRLLITTDLDAPNKRVVTADNGKISVCHSGSGQDLPAPGAKETASLYRGSLHGRNGFAADTRRAALYSLRHSRRKNSGTDPCAEIFRPVQ